jgi:hypothetical protein
MPRHLVGARLIDGTAVIVPGERAIAIEIGHSMRRGSRDSIGFRNHGRILRVHRMELLVRREVAIGIAAIRRSQSEGGLGGRKINDGRRGSRLLVLGVPRGVC